jgi:hypothetical protein
LEEIVWLIKNNLNYECSKSKFHYYERVMFIDEGVSDFELEQMPSPRILKSHFPLKFLPPDINNKAKVENKYHLKAELVTNFYKNCIVQRLYIL